jgi:hypothetical protein
MSINKIVLFLIFGLLIGHLRAQEDIIMQAINKYRKENSIDTLIKGEQNTEALKLVKKTRTDKEMRGKSDEIVYRRALSKVRIYDVDISIIKVKKDKVIKKTFTDEIESN